jgi:hypothetical protein
MEIQKIVSIGRRVVRIKGLRFAVLAVKRFRTALLLIVAAISFCMLAVLSAFTLVTHLAWRTVDGISPFDGVSIVCLTLLVVGGALFWAAMSPKRWMRTLGVDAWVAGIAKEKQKRERASPTQPEPFASESEISKEDLAALIERIVQKRVDQALRPSAVVSGPATPPPDTRESDIRPRVAS